MHSSVVVTARAVSVPPNLGCYFMKNDGGQIVETAVEARGGFLDRPVMNVLMISTGVTIGIFAAIYIAFFAL